MSGSLIIRGLSLFGMALLALGHDAGAASAGSETREAPSIYGDSYTGPPLIRRIPGVRILFGDPATDAQETDDVSGQTKKKKQQQQLLAPSARLRALDRRKLRRVCLCYHARSRSFAPGNRKLPCRGLTKP